MRWTENLWPQVLWRDESSFNIIEAVCDNPDREQIKKASNIQRQVLDVLQETRRTFPEDYLNKSQKSLSKRAMLHSKGAHTY